MGKEQLLWWDWFAVCRACMQSFVGLVDIQEVAFCLKVGRFAADLGNKCIRAPRY